MTNFEGRELKKEILREFMIKLEEKLKPLSEALKIFTPNTFREQPERFERDGLGRAIKRKEVLKRDGLGCVKKKEVEIERDGFGRRINRKFAGIPEEVLLR